MDNIVTRKKWIDNITVITALWGASLSTFIFLQDYLSKETIISSRLEVIKDESVTKTTNYLPGQFKVIITNSGNVPINIKQVSVYPLAEHLKEQPRYDLQFEKDINGEKHKGLPTYLPTGDSTIASVKIANLSEYFNLDTRYLVHFSLSNGETYYTYNKPKQPETRDQYSALQQLSPYMSKLSFDTHKAIKN